MMNKTFNSNFYQNMNNNEEEENEEYEDDEEGENESEEEEEEKYNFRCIFDGAAFIEENHYKIHFMRCHPNKFPFFCNICKRGFNSYEAILSHKQNSLIHKRKIIRNNFYCKLCNRSFGSKNALLAHIKDKKHYLCKTCQKIFLSSIAINMHCKDKNHIY